MIFFIVWNGTAHSNSIEVHKMNAIEWDQYNYNIYDIQFILLCIYLLHFSMLFIIKLNFQVEYSFHNRLFIYGHFNYFFLAVNNFFCWKCIHRKQKHFFFLWNKILNYKIPVLLVEWWKVQSTIVRMLPVGQMQRVCKHNHRRIV